MDVLSVLLLVVILILVILNKISVSDKLNNLEHRVIELQNLLKRQEQQAKPLETAKSEVKTGCSAACSCARAAKGLRKSRRNRLPRCRVTVERPKPVELPPETVVERQKEVISDSRSPINRPVKTWQPQPVPGN